MGYIKIKEEYIEEIQTNASVYEHNSKAVVITLKNSDRNKVFCITLRTPPENNRGAAHVIEHCVLCGSEKYNIKDPFNELSKGTIKTYLNAITFSEKTMYPVASTNEKEFFKMMDVYLDAVFFPRVYEREEIFWQEGHYKNKNGINGIVYNEMRGAFSTPERRLYYELRKHMYPDVRGRYDSGGIPEEIPGLTYDELLKFHKEYYHPSNCIIYLYGDIDMAYYLDYIERGFLSKFEKSEIKISYGLQKPFLAPREIKETYSTDSNGAANYFGAGYVFPFSSNSLMKMNFDIICYMLLKTQASPLKIELLKNGLSADVYGYFDDGIYQPGVCIVAEKSNYSDIKFFRDIVCHTLGQITEKGIEKELIKAGINRYEFLHREEDYGYKPKGLYICIELMRTFLYYDYSFEPIKKAMIMSNIRNTDFDKLIKTYMLNNNHAVYILLEGKREKNKKLPVSAGGELKQELLVKKYQMAGDKKEEVEKIRILKRDELSREIDKIILNEDRIGNICINFIEENTNGINYINFAFETTSVKYIHYIGLLKYMLGKLDTLNFGREKLANMIDCYTGGAGIFFEAYSSVDSGKWTPFISLNVKCLDRYIKEAVDIMKEIIVNTLFDDKEQIRRLISELKAKMEKNIIKNGNKFAKIRSFSYYKEAYAYTDLVEGIEFYIFVKNLYESFERKYEDIIMCLKDTKTRLFSRGNLEILIMTERYNKEIGLIAEDFIKSLNSKKYNSEDFYSAGDKGNEAIIVDSKVHYNVLTGDYKREGYKYSGTLLVLNKIIESDYIWNKIRLEGGAYGGGSEFRRNGIMSFYSCKDPHIERTYDIYKKVWEYIESISMEEREMEKYIIGAIGTLDRPLKVKEKASIALGRKKAGINEKFLERERNEVLETNQTKIKDYAGLLRNISEQNHICTVGRREEILNIAEIYDNLVYI